MPGSPSMILSRKLVEFSVLGWDNLPRTLLMFFSNMRSAQRGYFHTLVCNSKNFHNTVVNSDLRFNSWNNKSSKQIRDLKLADFDKMIGSGAAFAGSFVPNDPVLDKIDAAVLHRGWGKIAPGGWCLGRSSRGRDPCLSWGDPGILRPGPGAKRFENLLLQSMRNSSAWTNLCRNLTPCGFVGSRIGVYKLQGQDLAAPAFRVLALLLSHLT
ncbi:hypothetical protein Taro_046576 [Colocasia esculenta]|uniref:Uncharacterized protein n=1 Tax=Colocasia esculenta TaxID=4460 RepID=A0A843WZF8_COLES|nr:hypothetical protein [Colocasia esculenta]